MNRNGNVSTAVALCASSQLRSPLPGRKVKKSLKMRLCTTTPHTSATNMHMDIQPTSQ